MISPIISIGSLVFIGTIPTILNLSRQPLREINYPDSRRAAMIHALAAQNGPSANLDRLAQPGTVAIVTGQQVGLFSGPAYTIYKAVTAARLAKELSDRGTPAVPVFWLATEDHDLAEVDHAWVFDSARQPVALKAQTKSNGRPKPVGGIVIESSPMDELSASLEMGSPTPTK